MIILPIITLISGLAPALAPAAPTVVVTSKAALIRQGPGHAKVITGVMREDKIRQPAATDHAERARLRLDRLVSVAQTRLLAHIADRTLNPGHPALANEPPVSSRLVAKITPVCDFNKLKLLVNEERSDNASVYTQAESLAMRPQFGIFQGYDDVLSAELRLVGEHPIGFSTVHASDRSVHMIGRNPEIIVCAYHDLEAG